MQFVQYVLITCGPQQSPAYIQGRNLFTCCEYQFAPERTHAACQFKVFSVYGCHLSYQHTAVVSTAAVIVGIVAMTIILVCWKATGSSTGSRHYRVGRARAARAIACVKLLQLRAGLGNKTFPFIAGLAVTLMLTLFWRRRMLSSRAACAHRGVRVKNTYDIIRLYALTLSPKCAFAAAALMLAVHPVVVTMIRGFAVLVRTQAARL